MLSLILPSRLPYSSNSSFLQSFVVSVPSVVEPESQRLRELRQPQCHQGKDPVYLAMLVSYPDFFTGGTRSDAGFFLAPLQPTPTLKFLQGYAGAVSSAVSIAVSDTASF